jgi:CRISPR-associated protein Cas6
MSEPLTLASRTVDLVFPVTPVEGGTAILPVDHAYPLFAALCRIVPQLHGDRHVGITPLAGRLLGERRMAIDRWAQLILRMPLERVATFLTIAGNVLDIDGTRLAVGAPDVRALRPVSALRSRLVVIRGFTEPEPFLTAAHAQLAALGIRDATVRLVPRRAARPWERDGRGGHGPWIRRTVRIRDHEVVGYALDVEGLTSADSLLLQAIGIGGRRRFGCGLFLSRKER